MTPIIVDAIAIAFIGIWLIFGWTRGITRFLLGMLMLAGTAVGAMFFYTQVPVIIDIFFDRSDSRHWILSLVGTVIASASIFAMLMLLIKGISSLILSHGVASIFDRSLGAGMGALLGALLLFAGDASWRRVAGVERNPVWYDQSNLHALGLLYGDRIIEEVESWELGELLQQAVEGSDENANRYVQELWKQNQESDSQ